MLVQLIGCAGSGKDTFAQYVRDHSVTPVDILKFAAPLKVSAEMVFGANFDLREVKEVQSFWCMTGMNRATSYINGVFGIDVSKEPWDAFMSPRQFQQELGNRVREVQPDAFVDRLREAHGIITDTRFPNELIWREGEFTDLLYIHRPNIEPMDHPSEEMANEAYHFCEEFKKVHGKYPIVCPVGGLIAYVILNDGSLSALEAEAIQYLDDLDERELTINA